MRIPFSVVLLIFFFPFHSHAQLYFQKTNDIPVIQHNDTLKLGWAGGLNNAQFNAIDLNNDGIKDLVVFDRSGDQLLTFLNHGTANQTDYTYAPQFEHDFPVIRNWMLLRDMNCDGTEDLIRWATSGSSYFMEYFEASYNANNEIQFTYKKQLLYNGIAGDAQISVIPVDYPGIIDVNGDGDMDVLTYDPGGFRMQYYENQSMESTGTCGDSIYFIKEDDCWGKFYESGLKKSVDLNVSCSHIMDQDGSRHAGNTTLPLDIDKDHDIDLIIGNISFTNLDELTNGGDQISALITSQDSLFPTYDSSARVIQWPAAFYVDVDNDGVRDLIATPNAENISQDYRCVWLYKNIGEDDSLKAHLIEDTFMVSDMMDVGEHSFPVFFDANADGLPDLLVSNYGYYVEGGNFKSSIAYYQNVGTATSPKFKLITRTYENIESNGLNAIYPTFGDLDGDGDEDMLIGDDDGNLHLYTNTAGQDNPAHFVLTQPDYQSIDIGQYATPQLIDLNGDSLLDLVIGEKNGSLNFIANEGTATNALFPDSDMIQGWGGVDVRQPGYTTGYAVPYFYNFNDSNGLTLLVGCERGLIYRYTNIEGNLNGNFTMKDSMFTNRDFGTFAAPAVIDIDQNDSADIFVGSQRGGVMLLRQSSTAPEFVDQTVLDESINLYPNPANDFVLLSLKAELGATSFQIFNIQGQLIESKKTSSSSIEKINTQAIANGIYFLRVNWRNGQSVVKKFIVQH